MIPLTVTVLDTTLVEIRESIVELLHLMLEEIIIHTNLFVSDSVRDP